MLIMFFLFIFSFLIVPYQLPPPTYGTNQYKPGKLPKIALFMTTNNVKNKLIQELIKWIYRGVNFVTNIVNLIA